MQSLSRTTKSLPASRRCADALLNVLPGLMRFVRRQMRSRRAAGLSVPQFRTLVQLHRRPETSLSIVAEALGATAPTASRIVSGLVRKGFIVRQASRKDRRQISLQLTPQGQAAMEAAWSGTQAVLAEQLAALSAAQLSTLGEAMTLLGSVFGSLGESPQTRTSQHSSDDSMHTRARQRRASR